MSEPQPQTSNLNHNFMFEPQLQTLNWNLKFKLKDDPEIKLHVRPSTSFATLRIQP